MEGERLLINKEGWKRLTAGHPWIFKDGFTTLPKEGFGEILPLYDRNDHCLGRGFYNPRSRIVFRVITREDREINADFWESRLETAIALRKTFNIDSTAHRLVYSEADGFPGLIVDDYNGFLSVQIQTLGMDKIRDLLVALLQKNCAPQAVVLRNDSPIRKLEGLPQEKTIISGSLPKTLEVQEGNLRLAVDLMEGQKTGAYLDQRDNRLFLRKYARNRKVLDACCYDGWFALHLARSGATHVLALDSSAAALKRLERNAEMNDLANITSKKANCFDALKTMAEAGELFDLIVLDPPPFARRRTDIGNALKAYKQLNARAMACLNPGGLLFTCCCSHGVSQDRFATCVTTAAQQAKRRLILLEQRLQPADHPILFNEPESLYLKGLLFRCESL
ncbi:MAG: class I SAM-dependent rRNA methyltransferase [Planctomycetes bacterium]|nr:class I SAM-dependent rRNA methyltransferase [Planctomycetota bacterium]